VCVCVQFINRRSDWFRKQPDKMLGAVSAWDILKAVELQYGVKLHESHLFVDKVCMRVYMCMWREIMRGLQGGETEGCVPDGLNPLTCSLTFFCLRRPSLRSGRSRSLSTSGRKMTGVWA
jgi:hypothetical protein